MSISETYSQPCETSKRECFAKVVNGLQLLTLFTEHAMSDVWQGFECASDYLT